MEQMWACLLAMTWSAGAALSVLEEVEERMCGGERYPLSCFTSVLKIFVYQSEYVIPFHPIIENLVMLI